MFKGILRAALREEAIVEIKVLAFGVGGGRVD